MSHANLEVVRGILNAWNRGDVDAWLAPAHPEIEWFSEVARRLAGSETVYRGPAGMRRFWDEWHDVWDLTIEVSEVRDLGDTVVAMADVRTRGGVSGIDLERQLAFVFELEGGLARRVRSYFEPGEALEAVGLRE
jgi:ketosteroid isomerase-like protein